jgi:hypothetical protein
MLLALQVVELLGEHPAAGTPEVVSQLAAPLRALLCRDAGHVAAEAALLAAACNPMLAADLGMRADCATCLVCTAAVVAQVPYDATDSAV